MTPRKKTAKPSRSTVRHTRAIQYDRAQRLNSMPLDPQMSEPLTPLIQPVTLGQGAHFHPLGLRERVLTLPVRVALVLRRVWRQEGSPTEWVRLLHQEGFLGCSPCRITVQARSERLRTFPAALFRRVLEALLPQRHPRGTERERPLPPEWAALRTHFRQILAVDGSTLDALLRKGGLLLGRTAAGAAHLHRPFAAVSVEMVYRSIYYFTVAQQQGKASDPVPYLAENADWLGVLKRPRKPKTPAPTLWTAAAEA